MDALPAANAPPPALPPTADATPATAFSVVFPRLLIGWVVLICAEVFSGASLGLGLWHPWTLVVTYWLYFAHFFFCTTMAVRTGRTGLPSLYLWGVLYGLYESWITKVIWSGYGADGKLVLGRLGPFGLGEISMVFLFHPVASFLLPLTVATVLFPSLRRTFPDLAWFTSGGMWARVARIYMVASFGLVMGINSGGPVNLAVNGAVMVGVYLLLTRLSRDALAAPDALSVVAFGPRGFLRLCLYLAFLYEFTYAFLRPEALPALPAQGLTLALYAVPIVGLWCHRRREPVSGPEATVGGDEGRTVLRYLGCVFALGFLVSLLPRGPALFLPFLVNSIVWTPVGILLTVFALRAGVGGRVAGTLAPEGAVS